MTIVPCILVLPVYIYTCIPVSFRWKINKTVHFLVLGLSLALKGKATQFQFTLNLKSPNGTLKGDQF